MQEEGIATERRRTSLTPPRLHPSRLFFSLHASHNRQDNMPVQSSQSDLKKIHAKNALGFVNRPKRGFLCAAEGVPSCRVGGPQGAAGAAPLKKTLYLTLYRDCLNRFVIFCIFAKWGLSSRNRFSKYLTLSGGNVYRCSRPYLRVLIISFSGCNLNHASSILSA